MARKLVHWPRGVDAQPVPPRPQAPRRLPAVAAADLALRRPRRGREDARRLPQAAARGHQGHGRRRPVARRARGALPRRRVARLPLRRGPGGALRQRRLLRVPVAHRDLRQRAARGDGVGHPGGVGSRARPGRPGRGGRQRRHRRSAHARLPARGALLAREGARQHPRRARCARATKSSARTWCRCGRRPASASRRPADAGLDAGLADAAAAL